jgi:acetyltransferase-like isoleucine patch superfamily enzyme
MAQPSVFGTVNPVASVKYRLQRQPGPRSLVALGLSLRWRCRVSPHARILFPHNVRIGAGTWIGECKLVASGRGIDIGENSEIHDGAILDAHDGHIALGEHVGIGPYTVIYGDGGVTLGRDCAIAAHCMIVANSHGYGDTRIPIRYQPLRTAGIAVGADVWVGANCVITDGTRLEDGIVVGAGSVVRGAFGGYTVIAGAPAREIKKRESE